VKNWLLNHLVIDKFREAFKLASIWLAAVSGVISAVIIANPGLALGLLSNLPSGFWRTLVAASVGCVVFIVPALTRLWKQGAPPCPPNG
jgi:lipoprotein signal peptidase